MKMRHHYIRIGCSIAGISAGVTLLAGFQGIDQSYGVGAIVIGIQFLLTDYLVRVVFRTHGPARAQYERGYELGKQAGYREGRRAARPVVVSMHDDREHALN